MLLQTNSYIVPKDKRSEHARLLRRFRAALAKLGCDSFEVYEQVGANWNTGEPTGRYVQIMRFRDRRHQVAVQQAERNDPNAQAIIAEFCQLINFPYQQQQGLFAVGFYSGVLPVAPTRAQAGDAGPGDAAPVAEEPAETPQSPDQVQEAPATETPVASGQPAAEVESADGEPAAADGTVTEEPAAPTEAVAPEQSAESEEVADLGALLDAHLTRPLDEDGPDVDRHPLEDPHHGEHRPHGLEALDLDDLALPDEPNPDPRRAPDHAAR
jgi:hypothetical protein